jgi:hypothetical protein
VQRESLLENPWEPRRRRQSGNFGFRDPPDLSRFRSCLGFARNPASRVGDDDDVETYTALGIPFNHFDGSHGAEKLRLNPRFFAKFPQGRFP